MPVKFVVGALRRLDWTWTQVEDWTVCTYGRAHLRWVSRWIRRLLVVTGARYPVSSNKARGCCCRTTGDQLQPGRAARRYLRARRCSASRLPGARGRACAQAACASYASCRSGSICIYIYILPGYFARCPLTKPVITAVELRATTEPHCSRGVQPGGIYVYAVQREPTPGGPGSGLRPGRMRFLCRLPL
jgi:hypothetical protein